MQNNTRYLKASFIGKGEVKGSHFVRIKKNASVYLYQVDASHYEVFKRTVHKLYETETYPGSKQFGRIAWTYGTKKAALKKFKELTKLYSKQQNEADDGVGLSK